MTIIVVKIMKIFTIGTNINLRLQYGQFPDQMINTKKAEY